MVIEGKAALLKFLPIKVLFSFALLYHGDTPVNRTYQFAEIASHAFFFFDGIGIVRLAVPQIDGLMRSILAGDVTKATVDTLVLIDVGNNVVIDIQIFPMGEMGE